MNTVTMKNHRAILELDNLMSTRDLNKVTLSQKEIHCTVQKKIIEHVVLSSSGW